MPWVDTSLQGSVGKVRWHLRMLDTWGSGERKEEGGGGMRGEEEGEGDSGS